MDIPKQICRLCLEVISDIFETLDHCKMEMLGKFSLDLDLTHTNESVICSNCGDALQKSYDFKMKCLHNEKLYSEIFINCDSSIKQEEESVCRFCLKCLGGNDSFVKFNLDEDTFLKEMLDKCLPEIDARATSLPLICYDCLRNCQAMFYFVTNCLNNKGKTKKYVQNSDSNSKIHFDLNNASKFISDIKNEDETIEMDLSVIKDEPFEGNLNADNDEVVANKVEACIDIYSDNTFREILDSTDCEMKEEKFEPLEDYEIDIKSVDNISEEAKSPIESNSTQEDAMLTNGNTSTVKLHKCTQCSFESKHKGSLQRHVLIHDANSAGQILQCPHCSYETTHKRYIRRHMLIHEDNSRVPLHKCTECSYQSRHKRGLQRHMVVHDGQSDVATYKCTKCTFESKHKDSLRRHVLTHKTYTEGQILRCSHCSYETTQKLYLRRHMAVHKDNSEVPMHKCTQCSYESKHRHYFLRHMLIHRTREECTVFRCLQCNYETINKDYLRRHMLLHSYNSNTPIYKCTECGHETRRKSNLKAHLLVHKDKSEITVHKCTECNYESRFKSGLRRHLLTHGKKDNSKTNTGSNEISMHECTGVNKKVTLKDAC